MRLKNFMKLSWWIFPILLLSMNSCKEPGEEEKAFERKLIQSYIAENNITTEPTTSGLYYIEREEGSGVSPSGGDFVKIRYSLWMIENEVLLTTTDSAVAKDEDMYYNYRLYGPEKMRVGTLIAGLDEGLRFMKEGGKAKLIVPSQLAWGAGSYGAVPPYTPLIIDVELLDVIPDLPADERAKLNQYLTEHDYSIGDSTASGIYYFPLEHGVGETASSSDKITTKLKGWLSDGRVFVQYDSLQWTVNNYQTSIIPDGLHEVVTDMVEGEKALIILPYYEGYGPGTLNFDEGKRKAPIPPYSTLYYEMELLNVPDSTDTN